MTTATITSKGQTTVPKKIRDHLHLRPGDRIEDVQAAWTALRQYRSGSADFADCLLVKQTRLSIERMCLILPSIHSPSSSMPASICRRSRAEGNGSSTMNATVEQALIAKLRTLSPQQLAEVPDFVEFLAGKAKKRTARIGCSPLRRDSKRPAWRR